MHRFEVLPDDPATPDVRALLETHLAFNRGNSPPEDMHALDVHELLADDISFFSVREAGALLGVGALKQLDATHAEIKSMHTVAAARRRGVARVMVEHLLATARARGYRRVSLETGSMDEYRPARALYAAAGFVECPPFNGYIDSPNSVFMTRSLSE